MNFNLTKPCKDCPFISGSSTNTTLAPGRLEEIIKAIRSDSTFTCHKTLEHKEKEHCAGALLFLERENNPNQLMRIAERIGYYDRRKLAACKDLIPADY